MRIIKTTIIAMIAFILLASLYMLAESTNQWYLSTKAHKHVGWVILQDNGGIELETNTGD